MLLSPSSFTVYFDLDNSMYAELVVPPRPCPIILGEEFIEPDADLACELQLSDYGTANPASLEHKIELSEKPVKMMLKPARSCSSKKINLTYLLYFKEAFFNIFYFQQFRIQSVLHAQ